MIVVVKKKKELKFCYFVSFMMTGSFGNVYFLADNEIQTRSDYELMQNQLRKEIDEKIIILNFIKLKNF